MRLARVDNEYGATAALVDESGRAFALGGDLAYLRMIRDELKRALRVGSQGGCGYKEY